MCSRSPLPQRPRESVVEAASCDALPHIAAVSPDHRAQVAFAVTDIAKGVLRSSLSAVDHRIWSEQEVLDRPRLSGIDRRSLPRVATDLNQPVRSPVDRSADSASRACARRSTIRATVDPSRGCEQIADGDEVPFRLRHLLPFDLQEAVVHPVFRHQRRAVRAARLRDLVLVVRETRGRCRRRGCRTSRRAARRPSPSTRCASRAAPSPRATAMQARPASTASTARSPSGRACRARPPRARRRSSRRAGGARVSRIPETRQRRRARAPPRHRRCPSPPASRSAGSCPPAVSGRLMNSVARGS